ncbi:MAG: CocE/NonD family hydrolase, partial [Calditrichota bacterium]
NGSGGRWLQDANKFLPDRAAEDLKLLTYTSKPLASDLEITGHPEIKLFAKSTASDGVFIVYLEDVAPDGRVTYITEGVLRAIHRKVSNAPPPYHHYGPYRSYLRADGMPIPAGEVVELHFALQPTSVRLEAGHRIRVAISGHDASTFERIPESGTPTIEVQRSAIFASQLILPVASELPLGVNDQESFKPAGFRLEQNYPNPFNPSTTFRFSLENPAEVQLKVFDLQGREVASVLNEQLASGDHQFLFDASDLASGAYFYQMRAAGNTETRKMLLMK